jgi:TRAP-type C4-dicarboxylate transport system permease small subunit
MESNEVSGRRFGLPFRRSVLNWNKWVRQIHRWLAVAFTVAVIINIVAVVTSRYTNRVGLLAVLPVALLMFTGLYLFVLPYATQWRGGKRTD